MRDLSDTARFAPEAILLELPEWRRRDDGAWEVMLRTTKRWDKVHPIFTAALEGLAAGASFDACYERALPVAGELQPKHVRAHLRRFFWQLHQAGHVRIPLEPAPEVFEGRYRFIRELGRGGVGVANLCRDEKEGRDVVVKHAWGYLTPPDRADRSVRAEAALLRAFDHPGVARVYDEFEREGLYHMVREYADGRPLQDVVRRDGVPARAARVRLAQALGEIVAHVHARGYLLLDVTPANFILRADDAPIVVDVGICLPHVDGRAAGGHAAGSRGYVAPEVVARGPLSLATDVYGYGCLLQFLLTGRVPKHVATPADRAEALAGADADERTLVLDLTAPDLAARVPDMQVALSRVLALL